MRKTIDPLAQGRIGKLERVGDGLQTLPLTTLRTVYTAEDAGVFGVLYEGVSGRQGGRRENVVSGSAYEGLQQ